MVLLVLAILSALLIASYGDYRNYRFQLSISEKTKKIDVQEGLDAPTKDEISEIGEINENPPQGGRR